MARVAGLTSIRTIHLRGNRDLTAPGGPETGGAARPASAVRSSRVRRVGPRGILHAAKTGGPRFERLLQYGQEVCGPVPSPRALRPCGGLACLVGNWTTGLWNTSRRCRPGGVERSGEQQDHRRGGGEARRAGESAGVGSRRGRPDYGAGVADLKGLRNLCFLEIYKVGPSDLLALKDLPRLEHLEIGEFGPGPWKADLSVLRGLRWLDITYADGEIPGQGRLPADLRRLDMPCRAAAQLDLQSAEQISELHLYIGRACRR